MKPEAIKPKLSEADRQNILALIGKQPEMTCREVIETLNLSVSMDTVWRFLQKQGCRRKKKSLHASEQERLPVVAQTRKEWQSLISGFSGYML